jgi:hypothetical protein
MSQKTFALDVRVLLCKNCNAPLDAPPLGGNVTCSYCGAVSSVAPRPELQGLGSQAAAAPRPASGVAEAQRLAILRVQAQTYDPSSNPYAFFRAPPGLEGLAMKVMAKGYSDRDTALTVQSALGKAVTEVERAPRDPAAQRRCFWLARLASQCWSAQDEFLRQRAALETASEVLTDHGHRYILRCELSKAARAMGELASAEAWLAQCEPDSSLIDLDNEYRLAAAGLALARQEWGQALAYVGPTGADVPFEPSSQLAATMARAAALEGAGNRSAAETELKEAITAHGRKSVQSSLEVNDAVARAQETWSRLQARNDLPRGPAVIQVGALRALKVSGVVGTLVVILLVALPIVFSPVVCAGMGSCMGYHGPAMERLRACPAASQALGQPIRASYVGFSCGNAETSGSSGNASWRMPVTGSRASGVYEFNAVLSGGRWTITSGQVTVDGFTIDLANCGAAPVVPQGLPFGFPPGTVITPPQPGVPVAPQPGVPVAPLPGMTGGACERMAACCQVAGADQTMQGLCRSYEQVRMTPVAEQTCGQLLQASRQVLQARGGSVPAACF